MEIKRITLTGSSFNAITFEKKSNKFLVKNFSGGPIYVSLDSNATINNSAKINDGMYQIITSNQNFVKQDLGYTNEIYIKGTGEVEVQELCIK